MAPELEQVEYNEQLQTWLEKSVLPVVSAGAICGITAKEPASYNSCLWIVLKHELSYDWEPVSSTFTIWKPE